MPVALSARRFGSRWPSLADLSRRRVVAILEAKFCYGRFKARNEFGDIFWPKRNPLALKQRVDHFGHRAARPHTPRLPWKTIHARSDKSGSKRARRRPG